MIVIFASMSYFAMATGNGISYHHVVETEQHKHVPDTHRDSIVRSTGPAMLIGPSRHHSCSSI